MVVADHTDNLRDNGFDLFSAIGNLSSKNPYFYTSSPITLKNELTISLWVYWINDGKNVNTIYVTYDTSGPQDHVYISPGGVIHDSIGSAYETIPVNTWTHFVNVMDFTNDTITAYINGLQLTPKVLGLADLYFPGNNVTLYFGQNSVYAAAQYLLGYIDNVHIFDRILSNSEILSLYNA